MNVSYKHLSKTLIRGISIIYVKIQRIRKHIFNVISEKPKSLLLVFVLLYGFAFSYVSLVKYYSFNATAWDLGVFSQSFYTTMNNNSFFYNNLEVGSHFHVHFSPILLVLLPFYAVYQSPVTLLVVQAFAVALGAIPLYYVATMELRSKMYGLTIALLYLLYPALQGATLYDFHTETFAPLFVFSAFYFFKTKRWKGFFVFLFLALSVKEDVSLIVVALGLYGVSSNFKLRLPKKENKTLVISLLTILVGIVWLFSSFQMMSYFAKLDGYGSLWNSGYSHHTENVYGNMGGQGGLFGIVSSMISNPPRTIIQLSYLPHEKLVFLAVLFLPLCMISWVDTHSILLFLPTLLEHLLASNAIYFSIIYQYPALFTPVIFIAAVNGLGKLSVKHNGNPMGQPVVRKMLTLMILSTLVTLFFTTPIILGNTPLRISEELQSRNKLVSLIPLNANPHVLTQNDYFPHVSNSIYSYAYWNSTNVDYILVDVASKWYRLQFEVPDEYAVKHGTPEQSFVDYVNDYVYSDEFELFAQDDSLLLFKTNHTGGLRHYVPYGEWFNWRQFTTSGILVQDPLSASEKVLLHKANTQREQFFWYGPYATMPPGEYEAKFRLKISNATDKYVLTLDATKESANHTLANMVLFGDAFPEANVWQYFTLRFQLDRLTHDIEFRGTNVSNATDVYLDYISITQIERS